MNSQPNSGKTAFRPMAMCCALFFILGFVTWANGTLIPFLKIACNLETDLQAFFVTFASYIAYFFLAIPSSWILKKIGFKNGLVLSLILLGVGSLIFIPAADGRSYILFLTGIFVQGSAMALLQTAVNPYLSIIGPIDSAAQRISIAGFFNKSAGIIVPLIFGTLFLKDSSAITAKLDAAVDMEAKNAILDSLLQRVHTPYITLAVIFVLFAIVIKITHLPEVDVNAEEEHTDENGAVILKEKKTSVFQFPHLFLGSLAIFFCVAVEVMAGDIIGVYARELNIHGALVTYATTFTLGCMLLGYIVGIIAIPKFVSQQLALRVCTIVGILFTVISVFTTGITSFIFVALLGIANSLMWPAIFPLGIKGLGRFTKTGSAIMIMGIAGGAIWPLIYGYLKDNLHVDFQHAFLYAMVPAYLYILYFATKGHRVGQK
ncbi:MULTISPECIES: sugar MFS transporter [Sphingobacterium]|jgi:FHS family L-fucose permease-like MFS transporter|uniref:Sugar MFS transporter n=2 Tax=Sphingobacterium TaxID=28453 RepID=A0ABW5Z0Q4_9SPHI|nr:MULTISPECIES: sugar MFS transporter [Sphingobacterium]KKX49002.1 major facilitator transporter [Sphingobacterium sp. IITKGP-BTPF85]MCS3553338.1 glucose/galactose transporter [Sphingobacterium sp. JUb21]MCW2262368.1 glucose/galactose transporter [Sphingobacterium kitahiroshimense]TCR09452.1 glucose/galactose transporter [Sphingobacterium sp. JUb20]TCR12884.1 glucose/galactose transporter [Sphingobacterium sp. JUb78]